MHHHKIDLIGEAGDASLDQPAAFIDHRRQNALLDQICGESLPPTPGRLAWLRIIASTSGSTSRWPLR